MIPVGRRTGLQAQEEQQIRGLYLSLRRFAAAVAPVGVDPDDLVQDALFRVLRRGPLTDLACPAAYLRRCLVNLASNHRRELGRRRRALSALASACDETFADVPSDCLVLLALPSRARAVLYLQEVEGYPLAEIAGMLDMSVTAVRSVSSRARRRLRGLLSEEERDAT